MRALLAATSLTLLAGCSGSQDGLLDFEDVQIGGDFTLTDHEGAPYTLSDHDGEVRFLPDGPRRDDPGV
jgi:cytochrome oxidase Cu insertion factor (SCO1/SenC/PrrC family)